LIGCQEKNEGGRKFYFEKTGFMQGRETGSELPSEFFLDSKKDKSYKKQSDSEKL